MNNSTLTLKGFSLSLVKIANTWKKLRIFDVDVNLDF